MFQNIARSLSRVNSALAYKFLSPSVNLVSNVNIIQNVIQKSKFHSLTKYMPNSWPAISTGQTNSSSLELSQSISVNQTRSIIKYSREKGKRLSDREVPKRFFRLDWGMWIRTKCGRHKKMFKKSAKQKRRLRQHVMCTASQCNLLDKMVNNTFKRKRYYVDDPYEPYHSREEFDLTRTKPRPLPESAHSLVDTSP